MQKSALDLYAQQAASAIDSFKQLFPFAPSPLFDGALQGMGEFVRMQKQMLDLMLSQSTTLMDGMNARSASVQRGEMADLARHSTDYFVATYGKASDFAVQQNQMFTDAMKQQAFDSGTPESNTVDMIQNGMNAIVEGQKKFWDLMLKPLEAARTKASGAA